MVVPEHQVFRDHQRAFASTAAFYSWNWNLTGAGTPERVTGELVDAAYLSTLGLGPQIGRTFSADETRTPGSVPLAILGHGFWTTRFGGDASVIGRIVGLNGTPHTIVGVMPSGFRGLTGQSDLWVPVTTQSAADPEEKWNHSYLVVARRKADVSVDQARQEAVALGGVVSREIGEPDGLPKRLGRDGCSAERRTRRPADSPLGPAATRRRGICAADRVHQPRELDAGARARAPA